MHHLLEFYQSFNKTIQSIKSRTKIVGSSWYGYETLNNLAILDQLLSEQQPQLWDEISGGTIADIGGGDGELAFFLEAQGFDADLIDFPATNWNQMRGAYTLRRILESNVDIHEVDLDSQFSLPRKQYDLVLLLGVLYHLKNPYYILETLARHSGRLLLSTRVAEHTQEDGINITDEPLAYLLGDRECNNDPTNFWIFSETGLKRLAQRTGWKIKHLISLGEKGQSNPQTRDLRVFAYLENNNLHPG